MPSPPTARALSARFMLLASPILILLSPLLDAFGALHVSLLTRPAVSLTGGLAALGLCLGALAARLLPGPGSDRRRDVRFVLILGCVAVAALDLIAGGHAVARALLPGSQAWPELLRGAARMGLLAAFALAFAAAIWPVRRHAAPIVFAFAAVLFSSTLAANVRVLAAPGAASPIPAPTPAVDRPPFLYVVLDEAMGIEGLETMPGGEDLAGRLRSVAARHGFRVYERSFSRHWASDRAVPNAINFDFTDDGSGWHLTHHRNGTVTSRLFDRLAGDGYHVVSYGTAHLDFCFSVASRCEVLPSFDPYSAYMRVHENNPRSLSRKGEFRALYLYEVVRNLLAPSYLMFRSGSLLSRLEGSSLPETVRSMDAYAFPAWFDRFAHDVVSSPRGRAYFAHLFAPHGPYVLDASCRETGAPVRTYFDAVTAALTGPPAAEHRRRLYAAYYEQYRCTAGKLEDLLARLEALPQFRDATIVVHGDHGPRISAEADALALSDDDLIDRFSTLYAIRAPGIPPGLDRRLVSVQRLTAEYLSGTRVEDLPPDPGTIVLETGSQVLIRPMPGRD